MPIVVEHLEQGLLIFALKDEVTRKERLGVDDWKRWKDSLVEESVRKLDGYPPAQRDIARSLLNLRSRVEAHRESVSDELTGLVEKLGFSLSNLVDEQGLVTWILDERLSPEVVDLRDTLRGLLEKTVEDWRNVLNTFDVRARVRWH
jgi:hypothetical protein